MNTIAAAEHYITELSDELAGLQSFDTMEMYREILNLGKDADTMAADELDEMTRVKGCASEVHILTEIHQGRIDIRSYSNSQIVRGILSILRTTFNELRAEDFLKNADRLVNIFLHKIDVHSTLTPTRTNSIGTIMSMIKSRVSDYIGSQGE